MKKILETFQLLNNLQKVLVLIIIGVVFYSISTTLTYAVMSSSTSRSSIKVQTDSKKTVAISATGTISSEDPSEPKTEVCPLNGSMHTVKAKESWVTKRPLAVMIENHQEARPQSGLSSADVVYEAVAEGGITRFMALFYCNLGDFQVGPVRSARTYFLDWLGEYDALYAHVGGANTPGPADALSQIIRYKVKDLNQFSIGFPVFWRDYQRLGHPVATEHTMYSTTPKLWEVGAKRDWSAEDAAGVKWDKSFTPWSFAESKTKGTTNKISVSFWENQLDYSVVWMYDAASNSYKRQNGGSNHTDLNNKLQLAPLNIIIQFEREANANDGYPGNVHLLYGTTGSGKALFFIGGNVTEGKWVKSSRTARSKYVGQDGKEIKFEPGQIWIQTVPEGSKVTY